MFSLYVYQRGNNLWVFFATLSLSGHGLGWRKYTTNHWYDSNDFLAIVIGFSIVINWECSMADMIVLSSTCYWITRNCSKGELHFKQSLAMKNPCVWWWTLLWSTLDAIPFLVGLNPIFFGQLPVPFFPAAPATKTSRPLARHNRWQGWGRRNLRQVEIDIEH